MEGFVLSVWRDSTAGSKAADDGTVSHFTYLSHTLGSDRAEFKKRSTVKPINFYHIRIEYNVKVFNFDQFSQLNCFRFIQVWGIRLFAQLKVLSQLCPTQCLSRGRNGRSYDSDAGQWNCLNITPDIHTQNRVIQLALRLGYWTPTPTVSLSYTIHKTLTNESFYLIA